jgi:hypothetical protein
LGKAHPAILPSLISASKAELSIHVFLSRLMTKKSFITLAPGVKETIPMEVVRLKELDPKAKFVVFQ